MKTKAQISMQFRKHKQESEQGLATQYKNTRECQGFYAGDFMSYRDTIQFKDPYGQKKKAMVQFNKVKPYVNAVKGFMAQNRREANYSAMMDNNPLQGFYSEYANALKKYVRDRANADQKETQQSGDMLINGYGAIETAMSYGIGHATTDPNGEIVMGRLDPLQTAWDPYARDTNLLDARWVYYQKIYSLDDAKNLFQDDDESDFESATDHDMGEQGGYEWFPRGGRYNMIKEAALDWADEEASMVKVYFYQWYEYETFYRCDNPIYKLTNPLATQRAAMELDIIAQEQPEEQKDLFSFDPRAEILTFDSEIKEKLDAAFGEYIEPHDYQRKVFYTAVLSKNHVFTAFRSTCQQGFTIKFKTGDFDARNKIWIGMVNSMMEPAMYYNKALTELMFIIGVNSKGGVMIEKGAVENVAAFEQKYAKTDAAIVVNDGALTEGKIQPKRQPHTLTGYEQIVQISDAAINDANGIDKTFLGSSENKQETGILQSRRIRQVVSSLACYFDSDTLYQKEHSQLLLDFLRIYAQNNAGGMFRIIGKDGRDQFLRISADHLCPLYDVIISEAPQSAEEKFEFANLISEAAKVFIGAGDLATGKQLFALSLKYLPLDRVDQQQVIQILTPQQPQIDPAYVQKLQQQLQALMSDVTQADVKKKLASAALDVARIGELHAKVGETQASSIQKKASAFHDVHEALLDEHIANRQSQENRVN